MAGKRIAWVLVFVSLSCGFRLLLSSYGRFFVKFLLAKIADNAVARTLSLEATKRAFYVFVFTDFYRGHSFLTFLCLPRLFLTPLIIATFFCSVKLFCRGETTFFYVRQTFLVFDIIILIFISPDSVYTKSLAGIRRKFSVLRFYRSRFYTLLSAPRP